MTDRLDISARVVEMRESCNKSKEEIAKHLGISLEEYEKYETGESDIPIGILYELAGIYGVDFTDFLTGVSPKLAGFCVVKKGEGKEIERYPGYSFKSLAYNFKNRKIEPLLVEIDLDENKNMKLVTHPGQEFNMVIEGNVRVIIGSNVVDLSPGDTIYFDSTIPHGQTVVEGKNAKFLTIIFHG
ncbi:MAG: cupin domain-containing protein [Methanosarcinaceae archaeon]|nr:cupin domain-containing protein [Methanosarcinaceae archaeon]